MEEVILADCFGQRILANHRGYLETVWKREYLQNVQHV
jgi:hypothetical protein